MGPGVIPKLSYPRRTVRAMELWSPPHDAPHLLEWWRPLMLVSRQARLARFPWPVHLDEFRLAGRVRRRGRPDIWIYEHHDNGGAVCVDATGQTYRFVATPRGSGVGQFRRCDVRSALWRAGLPEVVEPVSYRERAGAAGWAPPGADPEPARAAHPAGGGRAGPAGGGGGTTTDDAGDDSFAAGRAGRVVRRGHLTLVAGCA